MKKSLKNHQDLILMSLAIIFLMVIAIYFLWGIRFLTTNLNKALSPNNASAEKLKFNLKEAELLNLPE